MNKVTHSDFEKPGYDGQSAELLFGTERLKISRIRYDGYGGEDRHCISVFDFPPADPLQRRLVKHDFKSGLDAEAAFRIIVREASQKDSLLAAARSAAGWARASSSFEHEDYEANIYGDSTEDDYEGYDSSSWEADTDSIKGFKVAAAFVAAFFFIIWVGTS